MSNSVALNVLTSLRRARALGVREGIDLCYDLVMVAKDLNGAQHQIKLLKAGVDEGKLEEIKQQLNLTP